MCGIIGFLNKNGAPADPMMMNALTAALAHRGPHGQGVYTHRNVSIGHRRLAIIDLETGEQPMSNENDTVWITYNGELYNYRELQKALEQKGHRFKTHSDTEVIIHAYEEWGKTCVERFRGMFAFAIVDQNRNEIFLARDHIGIKPLVYYSDNDLFAFSSELQGLLQLPGFDSTLNLQALDQYLHLHYIPPPLTVYRQAFKLFPAHRMAVDFGGDIKYIEPYWDLEFRPENDRSENDWLEELDSLLRDSVKKHLIADVPVGAFLSGGIDSTVIVKYMTELQGSNTPKTFSIGFDEDIYSELPYAEIVRQKYRTEHHSEIVSHHSIDILPELVKHYGEPFGDDSCIPTYYLSRFASGSVTVALSGDGGDEFFAGYIVYERWMNLVRGEFPEFYKRFPLWKKIIYPLMHHLRPERYPADYFVKFDQSIESWLAHVQSLDSDWRSRLWRPEFRKGDIPGSVPSVFDAVSDRIAGLSSVHMAQYIEIKTALPSALLPKVDIASMMSGLEVRTPLTDKDVAEFACRIPHTINLRKRNKSGYTGKYLLKKLLERDFGEDFIYRRKMGFTPPTLTWFSVNGNKRNVVEDRLLDDSSFISEYFNTSAIRGLFAQHKIKSLWLLLFLELWLEHHHSNKKLSRKV